MQQTGARSLPRKQTDNWTMMHRQVNLTSSELANLSIPSYLKDLYINLTQPNGVAHPSSNHEEIKINTIQSFKNKAKGKRNMHQLVMQVGC